MSTQSRVAAALIEELASSSSSEEVSSSSSFRLTEEQQALRIPRHVIYLTGLVTATCNSSWSESRFKEYQKLYHKQMQAETPIIFLSSPRNRASAEQQISIRQDAKRKKEELEANAKEAEKELIEEENTRDRRRHTMSSNKQRTGSSNNKKSRPTAALLTKGATTPNVSHEGSMRSSTLEQIVKQIQSETSLSTESDIDSTLWVKVSKKGNTMVKPTLDLPSTHEKADDEVSQSMSPHQYNEDSSITEGQSKTTWMVRNGKDTAEKDSSNAVEDTHAEGHTYSVHGENHHDESRSIPRAQDVNSEMSRADISGSIRTTSSTTLLLKDRIRHLEMQLADKDFELQQERKAHAKQISQKHRDFDNQIQALQLRLYISETRLKTFQDALEEHVEAVSNNMSFENNNILGSSPTKTRLVSTNDAEQPLSPLISRVLNRQGRLSNNKGNATQIDERGI